MIWTVVAIVVCSPLLSWDKKQDNDTISIGIWVKLYSIGSNKLASLYV